MAVPSNTPGAGDALDLLMAFLNLSSDASDARKAVGAARYIGNLGARYAAPEGATVAGVPLGKAVGGAGAAAGLGLTLADIMKSDASTFDKVGAGTGAGFDALMSTVNPWYGLSKAIAGVGNQLMRSSSPQVQGAGRALEHTGSPGGADIFARGIRGQAPWEYMDTKDVNESFVLDLLGPIGTIAQGLGKGGKLAEGVTKYGPIPFGDKLLGFFAHDPTEGTKFRAGIAQAFKRIPGFETISGGADRTYDMTPEALAKFDPKDVAAATQLARLATPATARYGEKQSAYLDQVRNMLLNLYGHPGELTAKLPAALEWLVSGGK